jgi:4'-phosphopantetheinyl transferase
MALPQNHSRQMYPRSHRQRQTVRLDGLLPPLSDHDVLVWRLQLSDFRVWTHVLSKLLSPDEWTNEARQQQYVITRALLRIILSAYTGIAPHLIRIQIEKSGKPRVINSNREIYFNVSRTGPVILMAFSGEHEVGIDVECYPPAKATELASRIAPQADVQFYCRMPASLARHRFSIMWSRLEAYAKATGRGVSSELSLWRLNPCLEAPWQIHSAENIEKTGPLVKSFRVPPTLVGAIASFGRKWKVTPLRLVPLQRPIAPETDDNIVCRILSDHSYQAI